MSKIFLIFAAIVCFAVLLVLMLGVGSFAKGGEFNRKHANRIMRWRIILQAVAVALILATVTLARLGE